MNCTACGHNNPETGKYCIACGASLSALDKLRSRRRSHMADEEPRGWDSVKPYLRMVKNPKA